MTDAITIPDDTPARRQPPIRKVGRPPRTSRRTAIGLSRNVRAAIDLMILGGMSRAEAAKHVGIADNSLYQAFRNPVVMKYYRECEDVLRTSERPRSIHRIASLRDGAKSERVQLEAAKHLDGGDRKGGVTVNVGVQATLAPGYMVDVSGYADAARGILADARSTDDVLGDEPPAASQAADEPAKTGGYEP